MPTIKKSFDLFFASNDSELGIIYIARVLFDALKKYPAQITLLLITAIVQWVTNILSFYVAIAISYFAPYKAGLILSVIPPSTET